MAVIHLPRDAHGRVLDPATGSLVFDPTTGKRLVEHVGIVGHGSVIYLEPGEAPYLPDGWEHLREHLK